MSIEPKKPELKPAVIAKKETNKRMLSLCQEIGADYKQTKLTLTREDIDKMIAEEDAKEQAENE